MTAGLKALPVACLIIFFTLFHILPVTLSASSVETTFSVKSIILKDSIQATLPANAKWSFSAVDIENRKKLFDEGNAKDIPLTPGSIVKLFVTAAVLDLNEKEKITLDTITLTMEIFRAKNL